MSSPLKQNTTTIQELLNTINTLPTAENLDTELNAQSTLISEQDAKIAELAQVLAGKAGGGMSVETCNVTINSPSPEAVAEFFYTNSEFEYVNNSVYVDTVVISVPKNTMIYFIDHVLVKTAENVEEVNGESRLFVVYGDCEFEAKELL